MAAPPTTLRCPTCGHLLVAIPPGGPNLSWASCPYCHHAVPVVPPRDPPPLYSWELYPAVYPPDPGDRPWPGRSVATLLTALLLAALVLLGGTTGALVAEGALSLSSSPLSITGTVDATGPTGNAGGPLAGATVTATPESGPIEQAVTGPQGQFNLVGLSPGRIVVNVSAPGYLSDSISIFRSATYSSMGTSNDPISFDLTPVPAGSQGVVPRPLNTTSESPFPDLETFVSLTFAASILLALGAAVTSAGLVCAHRRVRPAVVIAGGAAAVLTPVAVGTLGVAIAFPFALFAAGGAASAGLLAGGIASIRLAREGRPLTDAD